VWKSAKETDNSTSSEESDLSSWPADYRAALDRVARRANLTPENLHSDLQRNSDKLHATPQCLTLVEVETYVALQRLEPNRSEHVGGCAYCSALLSAVDRVDSTAQAKFVDMASGQGARNSRIQWTAPAVIGGVVGGTALFVAIRKLFAR